MGYHRAGFEVTGVDKNPDNSYPFTFIESDAIEYLRKHWHEFDAIHASPNCQGYSRTKSLHSNTYSTDVEILREELLKTGKPFTIENVPGAPLLNPIYLEGPMFDLRVIRRRLFETNWPIDQPKRGIKKGTVGGKNFTRKNPGYYYIIGGHQAGTLQEWRDAMGIDWMSKKELAQAIPPAYTEFIGKLLIEHIQKQN